MGICTRALRHFANLRYLSIRDVNIEGSFLQVLSHLKILDSLVIVACGWDGSTCNNLRDEIMLPKLLALEISLIPFRITAPLTALIQLVSNASSTLKLFDTQDTVLAINIMTNPVHYCITQLTLPIEVWTMPILCDFFRRTPSITSITFIAFAHTFPIVPRPSLELPLSVLPYLQHIRGPGHVVVDLLPGRPGKKVELSCPNFGLVHMLDVDRAVAILDRSTAMAIEHLEIPSSLFIPRDIVSRVRTLSLIVGDNLIGQDVRIHTNHYIQTIIDCI